MYDGGQRKGAVNKAGKSDSNAEAARRSLGSAVFPDEETEEGIFHQEVLYAVQRWFSAHGWPGGSYPIRIPDSLRRYYFIIFLTFGDCWSNLLKACAWHLLILIIVN